MKKRLFVIFLFVMFSLNFISANFQVGNLSHLIDSQYGPADSIRGWINISFQNESSTSIFSDSSGNSISLINLLRTDANYDYTCTTNNCTSDYEANNGAPTKSFSLGVGNSKILGIKFNEEITAINSIDFIINSNAEQSCFNQLTLDFLLDGKIDFGNTKSTVGDCSFSKTYGCYTDEKPTSEYIIGKFPNKHCQRINLSESPGFNLGAWVKRGTDKRNLTMALYDEYGSPIEGASCNLPDTNITEEKSCGINYLVTEPNPFYVCIYANSEGTSKIKGYPLTEGCGFYGVGVLKENAAFQIFAEGKKFDGVGLLNVTNALPNGNTLGNYAEDYLIEKYGSLSCSEGCVIPLNFLSQKTQDINLNNLQVRYETNLGPTISTNFYDLEETPPKMTSGLQKLSLNGGKFSLSSVYGETNFNLNFNGVKVFSQKVTIEEIPTISYITPTKTASAYPTTFKVQISASSNISDYEWDFGDGAVQITDGNKIVHTYTATGVYSLKITVTDSDGRSANKIFEISVESPEEIINQTLIELQQSLSNIDIQLKEFPLFDQESLNDILNLDLMEDKLKEAQRDYKSAISEEDYNNLMTSILKIKIPKSIVTSKSTDFFVFYPDKENVDIDVLSKITKEDYVIAEEDNYVNGIFAWHQENLDAKIKFSELSARYTDYDEPILRFFEIIIKKNSPDVRDAYIILKKLADIRFKENYLENEEGAYIYFDLSGEEKNIIFSTTENIDFTNLPLFISPELARLPLIEIPEIEEEEKEWGLFLLIIILILIIGLGIYIFLQEWYKRKYENYLFKNRNDLYNIVTFIQTSRDKEVQDSKIASTLRKTGWNLEQVTYAMKKYLGKRTGMVEIPIMKLIDKINDFFKKRQTQTTLLKDGPSRENSFGNSLRR